MQGAKIDFVNTDENSRKWLNEFRLKPFSVPGKLETVDGKLCAVYLVVFKLVFSNQIESTYYIIQVYDYASIIYTIIKK